MDHNTNSIGGGEPIGGVPADGLSTVHISPSKNTITEKRQARAVIYNGASIIKIESSIKRYWDHSVGKRGKAAFSFASRRRLMRKIGKIKRSYKCVTATLTYPAEYPEDYRIWKNHLDVFCKRLVKSRPGVLIIWKLELQKRGAPHYHLLMWGLGVEKFVEMVNFRSWIAQNWYQVVRSGDIRHLHAGTSCEFMRSINGSFSYVAKYTTKSDNEDYKEMGRCWGMVGRDNYMSLAVKPLIIDLDKFDALRLLAFFKQMIGRGDVYMYAVTALCDAELMLLSFDEFHRVGRPWMIGEIDLIN